MKQINKKDYLKKLSKRIKGQEYGGSTSIWRLNLHKLAVDGLIVVISVLVITVIAYAGSLTPSASPAATMHSLLDMASKDSNNTFSRTTDSLEAISDTIATSTVATSTLTLFGWQKTLYDYTAPASTALTTALWTNSRAEYLNFLNSDLKYLVSSSTASTTRAWGSIAYLIGWNTSTPATSTSLFAGQAYTHDAIGTSTSATSTANIFGWQKTLYDYAAPASTALASSTTWTYTRAEYLDALAKSGYSSTTISANIDGNILERLEYLNNRNMFSVVNIKNGSATSPVEDFAFYTQALGGVDDYNDAGARPTDSFAASWTQCAAANNYCKTGDSTACAGDVCYQDNNTGQIWSDYLDSGTDHNWWWANNCWAPESWANPGTCTADGNDACRCVTATSTPNITGCKALGDGNWRLPHQKELMQAYIDGSWSSSTVIPHAGNSFWSATTKSNGTHNAWDVYLYHGYTNANLKTNTYDSRCVR
ncbi:MAG: hypothetical protein Athens071412_282 [Parcubacteria group bacterium Athens0714_12]|nr:MAG: hypothetical protein Athens071412_282 [Parcubacteria group bacterium Athens0714_12]